jgi:hypothetical protein
MITERHQPTLWPQIPDHERGMKLTLESLQKENKGLKELVVRLSEIVLKYCRGEASKIVEKFHRSLKESI